MSALVIDPQGTLILPGDLLSCGRNLTQAKDASGVLMPDRGPCWDQATRDHGSAAWTLEDAQALLEKLCPNCQAAVGSPDFTAVVPDDGLAEKEETSGG